MTTEIKSVDMGGGIIHFKDGRRGLVMMKEQGITQGWRKGDKLEISVAESPVFRMRSLDTEEIAHVLLYQDNEQLLVLPD